MSASSSFSPTICIVHSGDQLKTEQWRQCFADAGWRTLIADISQMRPEPNALPVYPPYIREAKLVFDFLQKADDGFDALLFIDTGLASYFCGKCRKAMPAIHNAVLAVDMTDCLEWTLYKRKEPISDRGTLFTVELERSCAELADVVLLDAEQTEWLSRKGWHMTENVISSSEPATLEQCLHMQVKLASAGQIPNAPEDALISIVIPTYNRPELLFRAVDSALSQTWKNFEVIIVDDGSTHPDVPSVLSQLEKTPRINVLRQENKHVSAARNAGIRYARGEYVVFLDDDNTLNPDFLESCLKALISAEADVCIPGMRVEDVNTTFFLGGGSNHIMAQCALDNVFGDTCCLARREIILAHPFPETRAGNEDCAMYASMLLNKKRIICWPEALFHYRLTPGGLCAQNNIYDDFRTRCLPLEANSKREQALLSEILAFQSGCETNIKLLVCHELKKIPIIGKIIIRYYDWISRRIAVSHAHLLLQSGYFDANWYNKYYNDSPKGNVEAALHYLQDGWLKGYQPSAIFDGKYYLERYPDVKYSGINPLLHFLLYGKDEGRRIIYERNV